jgi:hypothetical protein
MRRKTRTKKTKTHWRIRRNSKEEAEEANWACPQDKADT